MKWPDIFEGSSCNLFMENERQKDELGGHWSCPGLDRGGSSGEAPWDWIPHTF